MMEHELGRARGQAARGGRVVDEKCQIIHHLPIEFVRQTIAHFNAGSTAATTRPSGESMKLTVTVPHPSGHFQTTTAPSTMATKISKTGPERKVSKTFQPPTILPSRGKVLNIFPHGGSNPLMTKLITSALSIAALAVAVVSAHAESAESLDAILKQAQSAGKPVVLEFTGSDWCPPCKMMQKEVFSTDAFKKFADSDILFVKLDFPNSRAQADDVKTRNRALAEKFNVEGFPTLVVLSPEGEELARQVGFMGGGPDAVIDWIKKSAKM